MTWNAAATCRGAADAQEQVVRERRIDRQPGGRGPVLHRLVIGVGRAVGRGELHLSQVLAEVGILGIGDLADERLEPGLVPHRQPDGERHDGVGGDRPGERRDRGIGVRAVVALELLRAAVSGLLGRKSALEVDADFFTDGDVEAREGPRARALSAIESVPCGAAISARTNECSPIETNGPPPLSSRPETAMVIWSAAAPKAGKMRGATGREGVGHADLHRPGDPDHPGSSPSTMLAKP